MKRKLRILGIHGLWEKSSVFDIFRKYFAKHDFFTPDVDWGMENSIKLLNALSEDWRPDVIIGYAYGAYAAQRIFEINPQAARLCVLIAPVGPKGMGVKSFFKAIRKKLREADGRRGGASEKLMTILRVCPFMGKVSRPILAPILVISGGRDEFVSREDAERLNGFHYWTTHYHFTRLSHNELINSVDVAEHILDWF